MGLGPFLAVSVKVLEVLLGFWIFKFFRTKNMCAIHVLSFGTSPHPLSTYINKWTRPPPSVFAQLAFFPGSPLVPAKNIN